MPLTIKWNRGISIDSGLTQIILDPQIQDLLCPNVFVTHAHFDHSKALGSKGPVKYSTEETRLLWEAHGKKANNWQPLSYGQKAKIDDVEVVAHNSGHVLGSTMYEINTPEGSIVYTGDFLCEDTLTTKAAESVSCDILIIEATFGSPSFVFPPKDQVAAEMIQWATDSIKNHQMPAFQADALGNAQEIIRIFNTLSEIPVTTHWSVTRMSQIYEAQGYRLDYMDAQSEEAKEVSVSRECIYVAPKGSNLSQHSEFNVALVSGWALWTGIGKKPFALSDHADFPQLLRFVEETKPKTVLTCFGQNRDKTMASQIEKNLGIEARPLRLIPNVIVPQNDENRIKACEREILKVIKIPGFVYSKRWIVTEMDNHKFSEFEIMESLERLTRKGVLRHIEEPDGHKVNQGDETSHQHPKIFPN